MCVPVVVCEDVAVGVSPGAHDGSADLAQADAVSPSCSVQGELLRGHAFSAVDDEGRAEEVRGGECPAYFQLFAYREAAPLADDAQADDAARGSAFEGREVEDGTEVRAGAFVEEAGEFGLGVAHGPAVEVGGRLAVIVVEDLGEDGGVVRVAECLGGGCHPAACLVLAGEVGQECRRRTVAHGLQVVRVAVVPAGGKVFACASATLREARVADVSPAVGEYLPAGLRYGLGSGRIHGAGDALITLAMVVGADVEEVVVFPVVPPDVFVVRQAEVRMGGLRLWPAPPPDLRQQPAAGDDGMGFEKFRGGSGAHFGGYDAGEVALDVDVVDGCHPVRIGDDGERAGEGLVFLSLPVERVSDGDLLQGEGGCLVSGCEGEPCACLPVEGQCAFGKCSPVCPTEHPARGGAECAVEGEADVWGMLDDAHVDGRCCHNPVCMRSTQVCISSSLRPTSRRMEAVSSGVRPVKSSFRGVMTSPPMSSAPGLTVRVPSVPSP